MKIRTLGAAGIAALIALTIVAPASAAAATGAETGTATSTEVTSERYGGAASGRALDLSVLGNGLSFGAGFADGELDGVAGSATATATGIGTALDDASVAGATSMGDGSERCVSPEVPELGDLHVDVSLACGRASIDGGGVNLAARGEGTVAEVAVSADILTQVLENETLKPILDQALGALDQVDEIVDTVEEQEQVQAAVDLLNGTLSELTGGLVTIPDLDVSDTVRQLVDRLERMQLVSVEVGAAAGEVTANADRLTSTGSIATTRLSLLPGFWPDGDALATVTVAESSAQVVYDRAAATTDGGTSNTIVRVDSRILPQPIEVGVGVGARLFCGDSLVEVDGVDLPVGSIDNPLAGIDTPLPEGALCTEISVGSPREEMVDGRLQMSTAPVSIDVARNAGALIDVTGLDVPSLDLPGLDGLGLDLPALADAEGVVYATGSGADATLVHLEIAGATAVGGGAKVMDANTQRQPRFSDDPSANPGVGELPRTGGLGALPTLASALLGTAGGLRMFLRRRSDSR